MVFLRHTLLALAGIIALAAAGCNSEKITTLPAEADPSQVQFAPSLGVDLSAMTKTASGLYYLDQQVGTGAVAQAGRTITVQYTGWLSDGTKFDSSLDRGVPFTFVLGAGSVISGWDEGVAGMKIGGQRRLVIRPSLGYGPYDYGSVPGNSVLVFDIQLVNVQ